MSLDASRRGITDRADRPRAKADSYRTLTCTASKYMHSDLKDENILSDGSSAANKRTCVR